MHSFKRLILHAGGQDAYTGGYVQWTFLRNAVVDTLAFRTGGLATRSRPVLVFINGQPWGVYQLRERIDRHFLADHYGITSADFLDTPDGYPAEAFVGDRESWDRLLNYVQAHDPDDATSYAHIQSQVDIDNLIDYHILQIYAANTDWPNRNVHQFRSRAPGGRWLQWHSIRNEKPEAPGLLEAGSQDGESPAAPGSVESLRGEGVKA